MADLARFAATQVSPRRNLAQKCSALPRMPRYFFHVTHERTDIDGEGEELPDEHAAWKEATVTAGQMLQGIDGKLEHFLA